MIQIERTIHSQIRCGYFPQEFSFCPISNVKIYWQ